VPVLRDVPRSLPGLEFRTDTSNAVWLDWNRQRNKWSNENAEADGKPEVSSSCALHSAWRELIDELGHVRSDCATSHSDQELANGDEVFILNLSQDARHYKEHADELQTLKLSKVNLELFAKLTMLPAETAPRMAPMLVIVVSCTKFSVDTVELGSGITFWFPVEDLRERVLHGTEQ